MIQYYLDLQKQVKAINELHLNYGQIQKIYSTSFFISFSIRSPGKTWHLFLGRGAGQEGVWPSHLPPPSVLRRRDNFLEYLRKHLSSCSFVSLDLDKFDRVIKLDYQKFGQLQSILFFWKGRKLYFVHHYQDGPEEPFKLLLSWHGKAIRPSEDLGNLFELFNEVGRRTDMNHDLHSSSPSTIDQLIQDELSAVKMKQVGNAPNFLQRKISNIEQDLDRTRQWDQMQKILDQGRSLDMYQLEVGDHKIKFEGSLNAFERRNLLFEKIKKLKRGEGILNKRLEDAKEQLAGKSQEAKMVHTLPITKPVWGKEELKQLSGSQPAEEKQDYKVFRSEEYSIGVGLSSSGNDQLRNKWASKEDLWLHLDGLKSAHAIIKLHSLGQFTPEAMNIAASILAYFSHFTAEWIPVIYTPVKNLKGVTGSSGMVIYKKEKHLRCPKMDIEKWLKE